MILTTIKYHYKALATMVFLMGSIGSLAQEIKISGVNQGKSIYIQNPLLPDKKNFCVKEITVNQKPVKINLMVSAIELRFDDVELYKPVSVRISHHAECAPVLLNPEAIWFHSTFAFREVSISDTSLIWKTRGERPNAVYEIERLYADGWSMEESIPSSGLFAGSEYSQAMELVDGPNKFRIKYSQTDPERTFYSEEVELVYYPEPITVYPFSVTDKLYISRVAEYEISTSDGTVIMTGKGKEILLKNLRRGEYVITIGDKVEKFIKN